MKLIRLSPVICLLFMLACKPNSGHKAVAVFLDPGGVMKIKNRHVQLFLNRQKLVDTIIYADNLHPDNAKILRCFTTEQSKANLLVIRVNLKKVTFDLNQYTSNCINIHVAYDDVTVLNKRIEDADDQLIATKHISLNVKRFVDSLIAANPNLTFDTLMHQVDLKSCPCRNK